MVKVALKIIAETPTWGGDIFNHTIKLNDNKNTRKLDLK